MNNIPKHIAFIMDGNGRWAKERGKFRTFGHSEGSKRVKEIIFSAQDLGVKVVTFFAFSTENWSRSKSEINVLMRYLENFLGAEMNNLHKKNIRFKVIGRDEPLPKYVQKKIEQAEEKTKNNTSLTVVLALNYGGRAEIVDAVKKFAKLCLSGKASVDSLDEINFSDFLYTAGLPDPDFLIRTSGEARLSNFLLWQLSYAELYFPKVYWPDFRAENLLEAIREYQKRERRFGNVIAENN